jgi:hypothetical protein
MLLSAAAPTAIAQAPGTEIVDSKGMFVGLVNGLGYALRKLPDGEWVSFDVSTKGLFAVKTVKDAGRVVDPLGYTSSNCTGTPYLFEYTHSDAFVQPSLRARNGRANSNSFANELPVRGVVVNPREVDFTATSGILYYPRSPFQTLPILSALSPESPGKYVCAANGFLVMFWSGR